MAYCGGTRLGDGYIFGCDQAGLIAIGVGLGLLLLLIVAVARAPRTSRDQPVTTNPEPRPPPAPTVKKLNPQDAALLNTLLPGTGYLYIGQRDQAIAVWVILVLTAGPMTAVGFWWLILPVLLVLNTATAVDAHKAANRLNEASRPATPSDEG
jgi:hypothetical protein